MTDHWKAFADLDLTAFRAVLDGILADMGDLLTAKRASYGPHNLSKFGDVGVLVRASDKMERLIHMHGAGLTTTAVGEDALDAWCDLAGYALLVLTAHALGKEGDK